MARIDDLPVREAAFRQACRIIPSRYPPVGIFDTLVDVDELDILYELEGRTNDRLDGELGLLELVPPEDRIVGPGTTPVMAAFTHPNVEGSRFSPGTFGVYYCAAESRTAIAESAHHRTRFLRLTNEPPCRVQMRQYVGEILQPLYDGLDGRLDQDIMNPDDYTHSQALAVAIRERAGYGLTYPSVRAHGGLCAALFRPPAIGPVRQSVHFEYVYDGVRVADVIELGAHIKLG